MNEGRVCRIKKQLSRSSSMPSDGSMIALFLWNLGLRMPLSRRGGTEAREGLSRADRPLQVPQEYLPRYLALNAQIRYFPALAIKEQERRWAEQLLLGHPGPLGRGVVGHIQLDAHQVIQPGEIGRASCRERVEMSGVAGAVKKNTEEQER